MCFKELTATVDYTDMEQGVDGYSQEELLAMHHKLTHELIPLREAEDRVNAESDFSRTLPPTPAPEVTFCCHFRSGDVLKVIDSQLYM